MRNKDVIAQAEWSGTDTASSTGNLSVVNYFGGLRYRFPTQGELPAEMWEILAERRDSVVAIVYSYKTPIAWLDAGQWIIPDVYYTSTTARHQYYAKKLSGNVIIPGDCSLEEYERVMNGMMRYEMTRQGLRTVATAR